MGSDVGEILVKDACILIDLIELNLLSIFTALDYEVLTTSAVVMEVTKKSQKMELEKCIVNGDVKTEDSGSLSGIMTLQEKYRGLSYADASVLELALRKQVILLSADGLLRKAALNEDNQVHGTLWIIEKLHYKRMISVGTAVGKLQELMRINKRITSEICYATIKRIEEEETTYHLNK